MKILICAFQNAGGGMQVILSIINELKNYCQNEYHIVIGNRLTKQLNINEFPDNFHFYLLPQDIQNRTFGWQIKRSKFFDSIEKTVKPDCVLTSAGPVYWRSKAPHLLGFSTPASIYWESPYFQRMSNAEKLKWKIKAYLQKRYLIRDAEAYFVQTDDVNQRLRKFINKDNVFTISNTYSSLFLDYKLYPEKLPKKCDNEIRLLTISTYYPHKNFEIIMPVLDELKNKGIINVKFVLTLNNDKFEKIFDKKYYSNIINVGPIPSIECPSLYNECDYVFLPTLLECFSANYAEAMCMGKPILTSDMSFARIVCNDAAEYFNPIDPIDIASKIEKLLKSKDRVDELVKKGKENLSIFGTAKSRVDEILKLLTQLTNNKTEMKENITFRGGGKTVSINILSTEVYAHSLTLKCA